jgi:hypothetical protein
VDLNIAVFLDMTLGSVLSRFILVVCVDINHVEDPGVYGMIILRWIFRKWYVGLRTGSSWLRIGTGGENL